MAGRIILLFYDIAKEHARVLLYSNWFLIIILAVLIICAIYMCKKKKIILLLVLSAFLALITNEMIRFYAYFPRPFVQYGLEPLIKHSANASFPSNHAAVSFAIATSLLFYNKKIGIIALFSACILSLIRVIAALHYPIDIIIGAGIGTMSAILIWVLLRRYKNG